MSSDPSPNETRLRLRALLNAQFVVILAVCLLVAAVGAGLVYTTHVEPGTEAETQTVSSLTVESGYVHSAEVTEPNSVFATGTVLDDRNTYFTRIAPELDVDVEASYTSDAASDVDVALESVLVIRNVDDEGVVYWTERETLATAVALDVAADETATASFALNSSAVDETAAAIEEELGASPGTTETFVVTTVDVDAELAGEPTSYTRTIEMELDHGGDTYTVTEPGLQSDTTDRTEEVVVEQEYGLLRSVGGPLLLLLGLAGAGGLVYARRETGLALTPAEREYLSYRDDRSEFDEWITQIRLPESVHEREEAEASSLQDLVDFAIDNDTGVVEDPTTGAFHAVTPGFLYTYRPPSPDLSGDGSDRDGDEPMAAEEVTGESVGSDRDVDESTAAGDESGGDGTASVDEGDPDENQR